MRISIKHRSDGIFLGSKKKRKDFSEGSTRTLRYLWDIISYKKKII